MIRNLYVERKMKTIQMRDWNPTNSQFCIFAIFVIMMNLCSNSSNRMNQMAFKRNQKLTAEKRIEEKRRHYGERPILNRYFQKVYRVFSICNHLTFVVDVLSPFSPLRVSVSTHSLFLLFNFSQVCWVALILGS